MRRDLDRRDRRKAVSPMSMCVNSIFPRVSIVRRVRCPLQMEHDPALSLYGFVRVQEPARRLVLVRVLVALLELVFPYRLLRSFYVEASRGFESGVFERFSQFSISCIN